MFVTSNKQEMRKSASTGSLTNIGTPSPIKTIVKATDMRKSISCQAFDASFIAELSLQQQLEAVTHTPSYAAGMCLLEYKTFPSQILNESTSKLDLHGLAACIASPSETIEIQDPLITKMRDEARIAEFLVRVRRSRTSRGGISVSLKNK